MAIIFPIKFLFEENLQGRLCYTIAHKFLLSFFKDSIFPTIIHPFIHNEYRSQSVRYLVCLSSSFLLSIYFFQRFFSNHSLIQANIHLFAYLSIYPFNFKHSTVYSFNSNHATFYTFIFQYSVIDFFSSILQSIHFLERNFLCLNLVYLP